MKQLGDRQPHKNDPAVLNAIRAVGELLAAEGETVGIVVVGGAAMILGGLVTRLTEDVDIIAAARSWRKGVPSGIAPPNPLPESLLRAVLRVARDFNLPENWMNSEVGAQWDTGLPPGFEKRIRWLRFGGLALGIADRKDLIFLKLYAAVDSEGPQSVHYQDLLGLRPSKKELIAAAAWAKSQDTSAEFAQVLEKVLDYVHRDQEEPR
ncbi:MAG: DUF6036 family nucleotidyltransferase [Anaerolineales bacterium]|jgi:hypothetical protein